MRKRERVVCVCVRARVRVRAVRVNALTCVCVCVRAFEGERKSECLEIIVVFFGGIQVSLFCTVCGGVCEAVNAVSVDRCHFFTGDLRPSARDALCTN